MNRIEHLLTCVSEEAGEVTQAACKAGRFGLTDHPPGGGLQNADYMVRELNDLLAIFEMLQEEGVPLKGIGDRQAIFEKKAKVRAFMLYSEERGTLEVSNG